MDCCRGETKPTPTVSVGSAVQEPRESSAGKAETSTATSSTVNSSQPAICGSPSKRLSPADVSGTNEEWETASEGSDGGIHPRKHKDSVKSTSADPLKPDPSGGSVPHIGVSTRHSPCTSGVPSLAVLSDLEHGWKDTTGLCQVDAAAGSSATQRDLNTDSANVVVNQSISSSLAPGPRLFAASFGDTSTKQPVVHDSVARFATALYMKVACCIVSP